MLLERRPGVHANINADEFRLYAAPRALPPKKVRDLAKMRAFLKPEFHSLYPDPAAAEEEEHEGTEASTQSEGEEAASDAAASSEVEEEDEDVIMAE